MFRWLLKPKFYSKCIYYVKCIKTRLETIEKRRRAIQKFTKSDIAELLRRGFDYDAYKRTEWLLLEEKILSCYEFIEKFIGCISDHLADIIKQSDCPEECKEAIPSLMYAAARISDLPELRYLRTLFTEKYGNSLEPYINKEFVERLRRDPPTREMKIKLLYDIAQEFSIDWDSKALKLRLYTHPSLYEERPKSGGSGGEHKDESYFIASKENEARHQNSSDDETTSTDTDTDTSSSHHHGRKASSSSFGSISEDDHEQVKEIKKPNSFWHIPPPYIKQQKTNNKGGESNNNSNKTTDSEAIQKNIDSSGGMKPTISLETSSSTTTKGYAQMWGGGWRMPSTLPDYDDFIARFKAFTGRS
ncbi:Regulator of Vps4 activity in the MVB pathway protein [Trifolium repens]|nr:Regulator of Vps4 activity in the MVB pathway protein [Trifolium repens]